MEPMLSAQAQEKFFELKQRLARVDDLISASDVLQWDQETYMPAGGAPARANQIATLQELAHDYFTSDEIGELLEQLEPEVAALAPDGFESALVRVTRRDYDREVKIPSSLVNDTARAIALGKEAWKTARQTDTFATFAPFLQRIVDLQIARAEALGYNERIYDALLDQYEPGMKTAEVEQVFAGLRGELVDVVRRIAEKEQPDDSVLFQHFDREKQWAFGESVITDFGYDFTRGRQDISAHPFTTSFSISDVRLTTRIDEHFFSPALFGTLHEAGHGLYEQGIDSDAERTPLADGASLGLHESQSRLWENQIGRSRGFWEHYYPHLQQIFPDQLRSVTVESFYRAINRVEPSFIRVESDEVTYNLHIMLRFELENVLLERKVAIDDLPELWNTKMEEYLGIRPESDAYGVLQDVHWAEGLFGYFPTYALGNLMSAQLFEQARRDVVDLDKQISFGQFAGLLDWLRRNVHQYGRKKTAGEILLQATGEPLNPRYWLVYIHDKFGGLYGF